MSERIPNRYNHATIETLLPGVADMIKAWAETKEILLLVGPTGSGKTWAAIAASRCWQEATRARAAKIMEEIEEGSYTPFIQSPTWTWENIPELAMELRDLDTTRDAHDRITKAGLLILDDLGAEKDSDWMAERIYAAVGHRYNWLKPTIVTSNMEPEDLLAKWPRLGSRLLSGTTLKLSGKDKRLPA